MNIVLLSMLFCTMEIPASPILERTLDVIRQVESSGGKDKRDGDRRAAIGDYQIHRAYWQDGTRFLGVSWPYSDARDPVKARKVVRAYILHYQKAGGYPATAAVFAAIHNGGPTGPKKRATKVYVAKVRRAMVK
jgi:hypothetical protein